MVIRTGLPGQPVRRRAGDRDTRRRARRTRHGDDANASAQRNERGRQRNVGLSSVPALCRPFKLSVPPCLETPCKYVKIASAAVAVVCVVQTFFPLHFIFISIFSLPLPVSPKNKCRLFIFRFIFSHVRVRVTSLHPPPHRICPPTCRPAVCTHRSVDYGGYFTPCV